MRIPLENFNPDDADIIVEQWEWAKAHPSQTIGTVALGPCVGVALYGIKSHFGHLGHFVHATTQDIEIRNMIKSALEKDKPQEVKAWLRGGSGDDCNSDVDFTEQNREHAAAVLEEYDITDVDIEWNDGDSNTCVNIILDCRTGSFDTTVDTLPMFNEWE